MSISQLIRRRDQVTISWLSQILNQEVRRIDADCESANWSNQVLIRAEMSDGTTRSLRLKICLGDTFGRSEVDYYTKDYASMIEAPIVPCFDAHFESGSGYHILLRDLSDSHVDNKLLQPSLGYGLEVAKALGRLHAHHWCTRACPEVSALDRYFNEIRPGVQPMERVTGRAYRKRFESHEEAFRRRWTSPLGMSLLHGDLNPTNILTSVVDCAPVYFIDRQPFSWSLTYGVAVSDLAYLMVPWWPEGMMQICQLEILRCWYDSLGVVDYSWSEARADWRLSVEQCLAVPLEWCSKPDTLFGMQWLWNTQLARIDSALQFHSNQS